tara:strand:- start:38 stop:418 length:381 start_codon:yes stop_codon:yes gene_type:complete
MNKDITIQLDSQVWITFIVSSYDYDDSVDEFFIVSDTTITELFNLKDTVDSEGDFYRDGYYCFFHEDQTTGIEIIELDTVKVNEIKQSMTIDVKSEELQYSNPCYTGGIMLGLVLVGFLLVKKLLK